MPILLLFWHSSICNWKIHTLPAHVLGLKEPIWVERDGHRSSWCYNKICHGVTMYILSKIRWNQTCTPFRKQVRLFHPHFCKLQTFKKSFNPPWLKKLVGCSYLLSKYHMKILWDKKLCISFYFNFWKMGTLHVGLWRLAEKRCYNPNTIYIGIIKHILTASKKFILYFFMKFSVWRVNGLTHSVKVSNQGAV